MRDEQRRDDRRPTRNRRRIRGERRSVHSNLNQLRGVRVKDILPSTGPAQTKNNQPAQTRQPGDETMFKAVPSPDDPAKYVVQSEPMEQAEAEKKAEELNQENTEEEGEKEMPEFKPGGAMPGFGAKKPGAMAGGKPAMPPLGM